MPSHATSHARAWMEVDGAALVHNARVLRRAIPHDARLGLLVKANGYGHGIGIAARAAIIGGADQLMVATLDEGLALRRAGFTAPILVVYPVPRDGVGEAVAADLEVSIAGVDSARRTLEGWAAARPAMTQDRRLRIHVEIDTGMGRGGVAPDELLGVVEAIETATQAEIVGIWSHLSDGTDPERSRAQVGRYEAALAAVAATGRAIPLRHVAATEGVFVGTAPAYDMVRVGLGFYGSLGLAVRPAAEMAALAAELRPAMTVAARPIRVESVSAGTPIGYGGEWITERPSRIATLPIGYADGWTRLSWPGASALVRGRPVPLVGRVSMDSVCADVTDVDGVTADDEFVLLGAQGAARITVDDLARVRGTIPNEVFCAFGGRLERRETGADVG